MLNAIKNFFKPSYEAIISDFNRAIAKLETLIDHENNNADQATIDATDATTKAAGHRLAVDRAKRTLAKLSDLVA